MSLRSSRMYTAPIPKMPPGLIELMEGLTKDVLKNNPAHIYEFCSHHMQKLIEIRDGKAQKKDLTVSEKILIAQQKVRQRAEKRQKKYDKDMEILKTIENAGIRKKRDTNEEIKLLLADVVFVNDGPEKEVKQTEITCMGLPIKDINSEDLNGQIDLSENMIMKPENENGFDENTTDLLSIKETDDKNGLTEENKGSQVLLTAKFENVGKNSQETAYIKEEIIDTINEVNMIATKESNNKIYSPESGKEIETNKLEENLVLNNDCQIQTHEVFDSNEGINLDKTKLIDTQNIDSPEKVVIEAFAENESTIPEASDHDLSFSSVEAPEKSATDELHNSFENSMDLEKAAITIQKVFRAFLFKSKTLSVDDVTNVDFNFLIENTEKEEVKDTTTDNVIKERRSLGINRMDTVLQTVNEEKSLSLSTEDSSTLSSAATIIQAHVRGFLVRNKTPFNQTNSTVSGIDSEIKSANSLDGDQNDRKHKTILNIHIVPEGSNFISRDESLITSVDLSLDGSPHYSTNLHPLGYDKNERRKQLKREDAVQSISPPSNNSGKLSEDVDSIKEITLNDSNDETILVHIEKLNDSGEGSEDKNTETNDQTLHNSSDKLKGIREVTSDEADVVTPFSTDGLNAPNKQSSTSKLMHSGEFHDIVLPTMVSRNNTSVVREFQNVLVYFLLWNTS